MLQKYAPIGVMDSGVGGLSVVKALQKVLPHEDIIYFGDTANCPYGNKSRQELLSLSGNMLTFLQEKGVKCVALACNTTSALAPVLREKYHTPIITVAECAADAIGRLALDAVGLIATVATVNGGIYERGIQAVSPDTKVYSVGSPNLAALVESGSENAQIEGEISSCVDVLLREAEIQHVILGCTHYPLVKNAFSQLYPNLEFIDPAPYQAEHVKAFLQNNDLQNDAHKAQLSIYTTGETESFLQFCQKIGLDENYNIEAHKV